jgi:hypothetical protein
MSNRRNFIFHFQSTPGDGDENDDRMHVNDSIGRIRCCLDINMVNASKTGLGGKNKFVIGLQLSNHII